ncbi:MAG: hypothetical protein ACK5PF_00920 [bacterium]|jgi:hypothetical protein
MRSKPTKATRYIHEAADYSFNSGAVVDWDSAFSTFSIDAENEDGIFMQGDEADQVIAEIDALCKKYPSLDPYTAALCIAKPYIENLWN